MVGRKLPESYIIGAGERRKVARKHPSVKSFSLFHHHMCHTWPRSGDQSPLPVCVVFLPSAFPFSKNATRSLHAACSPPVIRAQSSRGVSSHRGGNGAHGWVQFATMMVDALLFLPRPMATPPSRLVVKPPNRAAIGRFTAPGVQLGEDCTVSCHHIAPETLRWLLHLQGTSGPARRACGGIWPTFWLAPHTASMVALGASLRRPGAL